MVKQDIPTQELRGWRFAAMTELRVINHILSESQSGRGGWLVTANLDHLRRLTCDEEFATLCRQANFLVADGMPLIWASRVQGTPLPERVAGSSLVSTLSRAAAEQGRSVFLLGGDPGTAEGAARVLQDRCPGLEIAGICCPTLSADITQNEAEFARIADLLARAKPDIIYVALGSPKQELLISQLRDLLPHAWWLGVGISFSYLCGRIRRAPGWVRQAGMEWLYRLAQEPRRLAGRYLRDDVPFCIGLLLRAAALGLSRTWSESRRD